MKSIFAALVIALSFSAASANTDLVLPEQERWLAEFTAYVCEDGNTQTASVPEEFAAFNVKLGRTTTDYSLDNLLVKGTFEQDGATCNYSALLFADNAAWNVKLVDSKAYASAGTSDCAAGKAMLDSKLAFNDYKYLHGRAAIFVPAKDAALQCGTGAETIGLHFQVRGRIK